MSFPDIVELLVNGQVISSWKGYDITSEIYNAAGVFEAECACPQFEIDEGMSFKLKVNGILAMTGIIDVVEEAYSKTESTMSISGRDLMGLVADEHIETWKTWEGYTVKRLAEAILQPIPFINISGIVYENNVGQKDVGAAFSQTEPVQTVFEVLRTAAAGRGMLFYTKPDGTLVFGKPRSSGEPMFTASYGENVTAGKRRRDLSKRYRRVVVVGQQQDDGEIDFDAGDEETGFNVMGEAIDETHPLKHKTFVAQFNDDSLSATSQAKLIMGKMKAEALQLVYKVPGHSQNGMNWTTNELCSVQDERLGYTGEKFLISRRRLLRSRSEGTITELTLVPPGLLS